MAVGVFAAGTSEFMPSGLLPAIARDFAIDIPHAGLTVSIFAIGMVIGGLLSALATTRWSQRSLLLSAIVTLAIGHVIGALASSFEGLLVSRLVSALATGAFWTIAAVVAVTITPEGARARALARLVGGMTLANIIGVPLGTAIGQDHGWRITFWAVAVIASLAACAVYARVPEPPRNAHAPGLRRELRTFAQGRLWLAYATIACFQTAYMGLLSYAAPLLTEVARLPSSAVPLVLTGFGIGSFIGIHLGARVADRRPWRTLATGLGGLTLTMAAIAVLAPVSGLLTAALMLMAGVVSYISSAPLNARVFGLAADAPNLASAANVSAFNVGNAAGPLLGGWAIHQVGYTGPALVGVASGLLALGLMACSRRADRRRLMLLPIR